jgi:hypothetical protein
MNLGDRRGIEQRRERHGAPRAVMPAPGREATRGSVAGIHVFATLLRSEDVDGRDEPGHDGEPVEL